MMSFELGLLPSGHLHCRRSDIDDTSIDANTDKIANAFVNGAGEGLFALVASKNTLTFTPSTRFWYEFACLYLTERCHMPDTEDQLPTPLVPDAEQWLLNVPPMRGAEYLNRSILQLTWETLDTWVCEQINQHQGKLAEFLKQQAAQWRQVGRVCFHLAENREDPAYPFAFLATYVPELSHQGKTQYQPLQMALKTYAGARNKKALIHLLSPIQTATESSELIKSLVDTGDIYHPLAWTPEEAYAFLREVPLYETAGIIVRLPDWWKKRNRPKINVTLSSQAKNSFNANAMLNFNVSMALGDQTLTQAEWQQLMSAQDGLVLLKGQWVEVDKEKLEQALQHWQTLEETAQHKGISFIEGMRLLAGASADLSDKNTQQPVNEWSVVHSDQALSQILAELRDPTLIKATQSNRALKTSLRPYQATGVNWLWHLSQLGLGACLADDMGLGKTIQVIALLLDVKKKNVDKPSLLILPASLLGNWKDELDKFAPSLNYQFVHPSMKNKTGRSQTQRANTLANQSDMTQCDVVLTSYGMLLRQTWLLEQSWQLVILDEAQAIKNANTRTTKSVKQLTAQARIALTGTPIENRLGDLWSLFDFLCPGLLGSATKFKKFTKSLEDSTHQYAPLRKLLQPYILRRLKTDKSIIDDLPDKTEVHAYCSLSKAQAVLYNQSVQALAQALEEGVDGIRRRGLVLSYILRFKQICNHPSQLRGDGQYHPKDSGKFTRLAEICEAIASRQEKALIFTQFREMTDPLASFLTECFGQPGLVLHGGTPVQQRKKMVNQFQTEQGPPFFVLSIKAGGTGLNLTAASHVIHFDRWWNPAVENQATDRAFRIGQKQNVLVHKFVCQGTIEEKIDALITEKKALATDLLEAKAENTLTELSNDELINLIKLDINQIQS